MTGPQERAPAARKRIAIVTGASAGIGRAFLLALDRAETFDELWAIARDAGRLEALRGQTRAPVRPIPLRLGVQADVRRLGKLLGEERPDVRVLVNAAGVGRFQAFTDLPLSEQLPMIQVNDRALVSVTHLTLPYMGEGGRVYQMGSLAAFQPVPYGTVYAASKAFVLSFTRALNRELRLQGRGVRALTVCPGWVRTGFLDRAAADGVVFRASLTRSPEEVVARAMRDMERGRDVSVCGLPQRLQTLAVRLLPHGVVMEIWCRRQGKGREPRP